MLEFDNLLSLIEDEDSATESYSDISQFFNNCETFLPVMHMRKPDKIYTEPVSTGGDVFMSINKACNDLIKVNAYTEALLIYTKFLEKLEEIRDSVKSVDRENIIDSMAEIQSMIIDTMSKRDDYLSERESTIARYNGILKSLK